MALMELSLDTTNEAVDWVCTLLAETISIDDVQITQYTAEDETQLPWTFTIRLYLNYDVHSRARSEKIINLLSPLHRTGLTTEIQTAIVEEKPNNADIPNFFIHRIGKRFVVLTPDAPYKSERVDEIILRLPTTPAFGSGLHPATILSLQLLERYVIPGMNTLDLGSGSGILSVAIAKLNAKVLALDNDSIAVAATQNAVHLNGVEAQVTVMEGSLGCGSDLGHWMGGDSINNVPKIEAKERFDLIVANILARAHVTLAHDFQQALRRDIHGGILITSGFTSDYGEIVNTALIAAGFEFVDYEQLGEWVAYIHRLKP